MALQISIGKTNKKHPASHYHLLNRLRRETPPEQSDHPGRAECDHLLAMVRQITETVPHESHHFEPWRDEIGRLMESPLLETVEGEAQIEALSLELRRIWLGIAHYYGAKHLKSPPEGVAKKLPSGTVAHFDYARLVYPRNLEKRFPRYSPCPKGWKSNPIFFRSGLAAITALFQIFGQVLFKDEKEGAKIDMFGGYYETGMILRLFESPQFSYRRVVRQDKLFASIINQEANIFFLEPVAYDWELEVLDLVGFLKALHRTRSLPKMIVIDTTIIGHTFPLKKFLALLPGDPPPLVVMLSSGLKLDQEGLELANVGYLSLLRKEQSEEQEKMAEKIAAKLRRNRKLVGNCLMMEEMAILDVPWFLDPDRFRHHCQAVFANNRGLAMALDSIINRGEGGIFSKVSHPCLSKASSWVWAEAPFVFFHFSQKEDISENHDFLVAFILQESRKRQLGLVQGMSFGFRSHRFEIIKPNAILHSNGRQKGIFKVAMGRRNGLARDGVVQLLKEIASFRDFTALKKNCSVD